MRVEKQIKITNKLGLHARAAASLVKMCTGFKSSIRLHKDEKCADSKSIMGVLMLAATQGTELTLIAEGEDAQSAAEQVEKLFEDCFGEGE
ncbi:MAG: HPr family phosphocarrier protein [Gammaproteobacteria bacterium]|nr:HPr family phosphocarrier protein [Gammaproteobacteria bacterium]